MKILIADDEILSRKLLEQILATYGECEIAENGKATIESFKTALDNGKFFDLITLDISMPDIDGLDVLSQIREMEKNKEVPANERAAIIMVTASAVRDTIIKAVQSGCNDYIAKPFDFNTVSRKLVKMGLISPSDGYNKTAGTATAKPLSAEENIILKAVKDVIEAFKKGRIELPVFPALIQKIQEVLQLPDCTIEDVAAHIEQDQIVTLRLLSVANSVHYGGQGKIKSVAQALTRIGMRETQGIVSTIAMKSLYKADSAPVKAIMDKLFHHGIATAHMARAIVKRLNEKDRDTIFILGLTHDIGKVLLLHAMTLNLERKGKAEQFSIDDILAVIQTVHAGFGGALFRRWGFDESLIKAVSTHEAPDLSSDGSKMISILYLANMLTRRIGFSLLEEQPPNVGDVMQLLALDATAIDALLAEVQESVQATISII